MIGRRAIAQSDTGLTLVEVLMSVVLLVAGTVAVLKMFSIALTANGGIEQATVALALAQEEMESIKGAGNWEAIDSFVSPRSNIGGDYPDFDRQVTVSGDPKQVDVIVYWKVKGAEQQVDLATLFTNYSY